MQAVELTLRPARPGDASAVADVFLSARAEAMAYLPSSHSESDIRAWIRDVVLASQEVLYSWSPS
jgi:hypothetical protein